MSLESRLLPPRLGWLAIAFGVLLTISVFGLSTLDSGAPGVIGLVELILFLLVVLVSSLILLMRNRVVPATAISPDS